MIVKMLANKDHLKTSGFKKIIQIAYSMNQQGKGRKHTIKEIFDTLGLSSETIRRTPI